MYVAFTWFICIYRGSYYTDCKINSVHDGLFSEELVHDFVEFLVMLHVGVMLSLGNHFQSAPSHMIPEELGMGQRHQGVLGTMHYQSGAGNCFVHISPLFSS